MGSSTVKSQESNVARVMSGILEPFCPFCLLWVCSIWINHLLEPAKWNGDNDGALEAEYSVYKEHLTYVGGLTVEVKCSSWNILSGSHNMFQEIYEMIWILLILVEL